MNKVNLSLNKSIPDCILDLSKDMANPQPVLLNADRSAFLLPQWNETSGKIILSAGDSINLFCPNGIKNFDSNLLQANCIGGKYFQIGVEKHLLKNVRCQKHPWISVQPLAKNHNRTYCLNNSLADIGFRVLPDNVFVSTMSICHDVASLSSFYSTYQLRPFNVAYQKGVGRLSFIQAREFNYSLSYNRLYSKENQRQRVDHLLGDDQDVDDYFSADNLFFSRGHLGGKVDFFDRNHQRSTFFYLNTGPQFQVINGGNWLRVEDGIRRFVARKMFNAKIVSGTHGVLRFPSLADGELFLGKKRKLPVPQFFYKLVYDQEHSRGVVFVSINNPHIDEDEVADYIFCENVIEKIKWVTLKNSISAGVIFACKINEFMEEMPANLLPPLHADDLLT